jgi:hypothetical protein
VKIDPNPDFGRYFDRGWNFSGAYTLQCRSEDKSQRRLDVVVMTLLTGIFVAITLVAVLVKGQDARAQFMPGQQVIDDGNGQKSVPLRTHSLYPPYLDSDLQSRWFDLL